MRGNELRQAGRQVRICNGAEGGPMSNLATRNAVAFFESVDLSAEQWAKVMRFAANLVDEEAADRAEAHRLRLQQERFFEAQQIGEGPDAELALSRLEREP
jgi:hypothetical protein